MTFSVSRIDRVYRTYQVAATDEDGAPATLSGVDFALVPTDTGSPTDDTTWTPGTGAGTEWRILLAGPDASPTSALVVPAWGGNLWLRVTDSPEVIAVKVDEIEVP